MCKMDITYAGTRTTHSLPQTAEKHTLGHQESQPKRLMPSALNPFPVGQICVAVLSDAMCVYPDGYSQRAEKSYKYTMKMCI